MLGSPPLGVLVGAAAVVVVAAVETKSTSYSSNAALFQLVEHRSDALAPV